MQINSLEFLEIGVQGRSLPWFTLNGWEGKKNNILCSSLYPHIYTAGAVWCHSLTDIKGVVIRMRSQIWSCTRCASAEYDYFYLSIVGCF